MGRGGGRSFSGGGHRASHGSSSFSSRSRGSSRSSTSHSRSSFGSYGGSRTRYRGSSGFSISSIIFLVVVFLVFYAVRGLLSHEPTVNSTYQREKLPLGTAQKTAFYQDNSNWITSPDVLEKDLQYFYNKTGVFPFVYIARNVNGAQISEDTDITDFTKDLYSELFKDEGHVLLVWIEDSSGYISHSVSGAAASTVMDNEALRILHQNLERNYNKNYSDEEFFGEAFRVTAEKIMTKPPMKFGTKLTIGIVVITIGVALVIMVISIVNNKRKKAEAEARILSSDIDEINADPKLQDLEDKYR